MAELTIRTPNDDEAEAIFASDARGFGFHIEMDDMRRRMPVMEWPRFRIALDGKEIVGIVGSYTMDMTVPGGAALPIGGVTWVSIAPTHRRRGILTTLIDLVHDDIADRGEPFAALGASEGGIYERFGYGIASRIWGTRLDRSRAAFRADVDISPGSVRFVDAEDAQPLIVGIFDRYRATRPGETSRSTNWWRSLEGSRRRPADGFSPVWYLVHPDGYAVYRVSQDWNGGHPKHELEVVECVVVTAQAHAALWHTLVNVDLVGRITSRHLPIDDPLPMLLQDQRALITTGNNDGLWVRPGDIPACLQARTYGTDDAFVLEVEGARYRIEGSPTGATCTKVRSKPDVTASRAEVGALLLGGVRATRLSAGGRLTFRTPSIAGRVDRFFLGDVEPHCQTHF